jgi:hypothetical protein
VEKKGGEWATDKRGKGEGSWAKEMEREREAHVRGLVFPFYLKTVPKNILKPT